MIGAELCAGYGGLGLALEIAGIDHQTAWFAEIDDRAAAVMARHHPTAPNLGDLTQITDPPPADIVTAGIPCQPVSTAGRRQGVNDERWIIDDVCRVARLAGARTLILENVPGLLTANDGDAMARVCEAMAREGFSRWEWGTVRASDVGAPHHRKRWFCVAHSDGGQPERRGELGELGGPTATEHREGHQRQRTGHTARDRCPDAADSDGVRLEAIGGGRVCGHSDPIGRCHVDRCLRPRFGGYAEAVARWEHLLDRPAPDPTDGGRMSPRFVEWMMGLPDGWVTGTPGLSRAAQLRVLGNGVVPQQAAAAVELLGVVR